MIRSLLLDLDGTLINTEKAFAKCFVDVLNNNFDCDVTTLDYKLYELDQNTQLIPHLHSIGKLKGINENDVMKIVLDMYRDYFIQAIEEDEAIDPNINIEELRKDVLETNEDID